MYAVPEFEFQSYFLWSWYSKRKRTPPAEGNLFVSILFPLELVFEDEQDAFEGMTFYSFNPISFGVGIRSRRFG